MVAFLHQGNRSVARASSSISPRGASKGQASDIEIHAREAIETRERVERIYAKHTGADRERIHEDMDRDRFFSAEAAAAYGLIDRIMESRELARTPTGFGAD